jgi:hypothetical protein
MVAPPPVTCGGETCIAPMAGAAMGIASCCTEDNVCGLQTPLNPGTCLALDAPGGIDPSCPMFAIPGLFAWYGCCTPGGTCGAIDSSGTLGCVPNTLLMMNAEQSCTYDPNNNCRQLIDVTCDGAEDCPSGEMCCGHYQGGYREFVCAPDCAAEQIAQGGEWSQICHPGDSCVNPSYECRQNTDFLPDYLYRCRDTGEAPRRTGSVAPGEVNCGDAVCGSGEKCCVSVLPGVPVSGLPVCVPSDQTCSCTPQATDHDAGMEFDGG